MSASCLAVCAITLPLHLSSDRQYQCHIPICTSHLPAGALFLSPAKAPFSISGCFHSGKVRNTKSSYSNPNK